MPAVQQRNRQELEDPEVQGDEAQPPQETQERLVARHVEHAPAYAQRAGEGLGLTSPVKRPRKIMNTMPE